MRAPRTTCNLLDYCFHTRFRAMFTAERFSTPQVHYAHPGTPRDPIRGPILYFVITSLLARADPVYGLRALYISTLPYTIFEAPISSVVGSPDVPVFVFERAASSPRISLSILFNFFCHE